MRESRKLLTVDSYDLKFMSFKFGCNIVIIFEMPGSSYKRPVGKNDISLLFRPSVIRGPCLDTGYFIPYLIWSWFCIPDVHHTGVALLTIVIIFSNFYWYEKLNQKLAIIIYFARASSNIGLV